MSHHVADIPKGSPLGRGLGLGDAGILEGILENGYASRLVPLVIVRERCWGHVFVIHGGVCPERALGRLTRKADELASGMQQWWNITFEKAKHVQRKTRGTA